MNVGHVTDEQASNLTPDDMSTIITMDSEHGKMPSDPTSPIQNPSGDTAGNSQTAEISANVAQGVDEQDVDVHTGDNAGDSGELVNNDSVPQSLM